VLPELESGLDDFLQNFVILGNEVISRLSLGVKVVPEGVTRAREWIG